MKSAVRMARLVLAGIGCFLVWDVFAEQEPDRNYRPPVAIPRFGTDLGPVVCFDEAHNNYNRLDKRFLAFGELLRADGYQMRVVSTRFDSLELDQCGVLVVANAQPAGDNWDDYPYPTPVAFSDSEVQAVFRWVRQGGRLLLIADHMPFPGAAANLAAVFGFEFNDGYAGGNFRTEAEAREVFKRPTPFTIQEGTLAKHPITRGNDTTAGVTSIRSFVGQAFLLPPGAEPLMILPPGFVMLMPKTAERFKADTRRVDVGGWSQGATKIVSKGRIAVFGEAGMFAAQIDGVDQRPLGMNAPQAEQNYRFVLNTMLWLVGELN